MEEALVDAEDEIWAVLVLYGVFEELIEEDAEVK